MPVDWNQFSLEPVYAPQRRPGRPRKDEVVIKPRPGQPVYDHPEKVDTEALPDSSYFIRPVRAGFIAKVMKKQQYQIDKRLARCPVVGYEEHRGSKVPLYDFIEAMSYLVPPRGNIEEWFSQNNAASLPPYVNKMFWDSASQRNKVLTASGQLWHTDDVLFVLGRAAMEIQQQVKMWVEDLPGKDDLTTAQYEALVKNTNDLIDSIRNNLVEMPKKGPGTLSMAHTIRDELDAADGMGGESNFDEAKE